MVYLELKLYDFLIWKKSVNVFYDNLVDLILNIEEFVSNIDEFLLHKV